MTFLPFSFFLLLFVSVVDADVGVDAVVDQLDGHQRFANERRWDVKTGDVDDAPVAAAAAVVVKPLRATKLIWGSLTGLEEDVGSVFLVVEKDA